MHWPLLIYRRVVRSADSGGLECGNRLTDVADCFLTELDTIVRIGDQPRCLTADIDPFIEFLGNAHGPAGTEAELAAGFLLQCRCGERRLRVLFDTFCFDNSNLQAGPVTAATAASA